MANSYKDPYWSNLSAAAEKKLNLPSGLLQNIVMHGEKSNADQVSSAGAKTVYQITPTTRNLVLKKYGVDAYSGDQDAAMAAGLLLQESLQRNKGNIEAAVGEYHGGTSRKNWGPINQAYRSRVMDAQGLGTMNDLHQLVKGYSKITPVAYNGGSIKSNFASDIPAELRKFSPSSNQGNQQEDNLGSLSDLDQLVKEAKKTKDLGTQPTITLQADSRGNFKPFDWKAQQQQGVKEEAKSAGGTNPLESFFMQGSKLGSGILQGFSYASDKIGEGVNKVLGTNLDTNSYNRVTKERKEAQDFYNERRKQAGQGFDGWGLVGEIASTAPLIGGTGGASLLSVLGRGGLQGAGIGATTFANDSNERVSNIAGGAVGGAAGGVIAKKVGDVVRRGVNAAQGRLRPEVADIEKLAKDFNVRTSAGDVSGNPHIQRTETVLDRIPFIGTGKFREGQQQEVAAAAESITEGLRKKMTEVDYKSLNKIQSAALSGDKNAIRIMDVVNKAGDDSGKILQAAAEIKNWRGQQLASQMYDRVAQLAGNSKVEATKTMQAIDDTIASDSKTIPNKELINEISNIKSNWGDANNPQSFQELRAARSRLGELVDEWGRQGKSTSALTKIRSAIDEDLATFARQSNKPKLQLEYKRADSFYKELQTSKDKALANSMRSQTPDEIYNQFVKVGKGDRAANFYKNLDPKGQAALRYEMANRALSKATNENKDIFSPAKFALEFERLSEPYKSIFNGADKAQMDGFVKLMRHVEQAGQYSSNPTNGSMLLLPTSGVAAASSFVANPLSTTAGLTFIYGMSKLFTTEAGKKILLAARDLPPNSPKMANLLKMAEKLGTTTGANTANQ